MNYDARNHELKILKQYSVIGKYGYQRLKIFVPTQVLSFEMMYI